MRSLTLLLSAGLLAAACSMPGPAAGPQTAAAPAVAPAGPAPANVAVLAIEDATPARLAPVQDLRRTVVRLLLDRGFTPLARDFVDARTRDLEDQGAVPASALRLEDTGVLGIRVLRWHDREAESRGRLTAELEGEFFGEQGRLIGRARLPLDLRLDARTFSSLGPASRRRRLAEMAFEKLLERFPGPPPL